MSEAAASEDQSVFTISKLTGFFIHGSTGCSCCRNENFVCGIQHSLDEALERAIGFHESKSVCSQYSDNGIYSIREINYEKLPDGRVIIGSRIFEDESFYESGNIAADMDYEGTLKDTIE
jgi:hypothetical protein